MDESPGGTVSPRDAVHSVNRRKNSEISAREGADWQGNSQATLSQQPSRNRRPQNYAEYKSNRNLTRSGVALLCRTGCNKKAPFVGAFVSINVNSLRNDENMVIRAT